MTCEDFEVFSLEQKRERSLLNVGDAARRAAALEHMNQCPRCAALQEAWRAAQSELKALRVATQAAETPARVEMRLRLLFRTRYHTLKMRRGAVAVAWTLAAAALLASVLSWRDWRRVKLGRAAQVAAGAPKNGSAVNASKELSKMDTSAVGDKSESLNALLTSSDGDDFTLLPGSVLQDADDAAILRVGLQRGTLMALGLPVSEDHAGDWIQVDLLVGEDGQPQGVRLAR